MRFKTLLVVPFLLASMGPLLAHAQSGTISFQGAIVVPTQSLTPDGIPTNEVVPHRQTDRPLSSLVDDLRTPPTDEKRQAQGEDFQYKELEYL